MSSYRDRLRADLVREYSATLTRGGRTARMPTPVLRRPRVLAGGTLGLAGVAAGLVIAFGAGGATAPPAFAITRQADGTMLVRLGTAQYPDIEAIKRQLQDMGVNEVVEIDMAEGPAAVSGAVNCALRSGASTPVKVLLGSDGTQTISPGHTGDDSGVGTWHLGGCSAAPVGAAGTTGDGAPPQGGYPAPPSGNS